MIELLTQPEDPDNDQRRPVVAEVGGHGSAGSAQALEEAVARGLCPDDNHPGTCRIPWSTMMLSLRSADSVQRSRYRDLFPRVRP